MITNPLYKSRADELLEFAFRNKNDMELLTYFFDRRKKFNQISDYKLDVDCCLVWFGDIPYGFVLNIKHKIAQRID